MREYIQMAMTTAPVGTVLTAAVSVRISFRIVAACMSRAPRILVATQTQNILA